MASGLPAAGHVRSTRRLPSPRGDYIQYSHGPDGFNWVTLVSSVILSAVIYP